MGGQETTTQMIARLAKLFMLCSTALLGADATRPLVIAHRGGGALRPENTIVAFQHALQLGVDVLEFDMNVTADDRIVIHHDTVVNEKICPPLAGSSLTAGPIRLLTLSQILKFDCGAPAKLPGVRMPALEDFLKAVQGTKALLLGETKMPPPGEPVVSPEKFIALVHPILKKYGAEDRFILQSGDYRTIDALKARNPRIRTCLLNARRFKPDYLDLARKHGATHLMLRTDDVDAEGVTKLKAAGLQVYSSTANSPAEWKTYLELKMDGILTDDPQALITFLKNTHR